MFAGPKIVANASGILQERTMRTTNETLASRPGLCALIVGFALVTATSCGPKAPPTPGQMLESAHSSAQESGEQTKTALALIEKRDREVLKAQQRMEDAKAALEKSQKNAAAARERLSEAQKAESEARAGVAGASSDGAIEELLSNRLAKDKRLKTSDLDVTVIQGVATIGGSVASTEALQRAIAVGKAVPGVVRVESTMTVAPAIPAP